jgi:ribosomal-protein-alanine N-acetyltransferase
VARELEVVRFRRWHLARVLEIEKTSFASDAYTRRMFLDLYRDCGELFLVAKRRGRVEGYIVSGVRSGEAEIISIAVRPETRGAGVGSMLMRETLARCAASGVRRAWLMVRSGSRQAVRFYRRFGFRAAGRVADYYRDGEEALRMRKELGRSKR